MSAVTKLKTKWAAASLFPSMLELIAPIIAVIVVPTLAPIAKAKHLFPAVKAAAFFVRALQHFAKSPVASRKHCLQHHL